MVASSGRRERDRTSPVTASVTTAATPARTTKPMLPVPDGIDYVPVVIAGVLIVLFSIEHILALLRGTEVTPSWN